MITEILSKMVTESVKYPFGFEESFHDTASAVDEIFGSFCGLVANSIQNLESEVIFSFN